MRVPKKTKASQPSRAGCPPKPARVLIVDDHPLIRKAVGEMINTQTDMTTCGEAASVNEALKQVNETRPDVVVVDISLPERGGIDLIREIKACSPEPQVLVLSMHEELLYAERVLRAGARGYVNKEEPPERLLEALRTVLRGELYVSRRVASCMLNAFVGGSPRPRGRVGIELLSDRELQVFESIGRGMSTAQIGHLCGVSPKTVETYRSHIKRKLSLGNGNELVHAAVRWVEGEAAGTTG